MDLQNEILELLVKTKIPKSCKRANITGLKYVGADKRKYGYSIESATLGKVRDWKTGGKMLSKFTLQNVELYALLIEYGTLICPHSFDSICINHNVLCGRHRDINNNGLSTIQAFGIFSGGNLGMELEDLKNVSVDIRQPYTFDGSRITHWTEPFQGDRYSIIWF